MNQRKELLMKADNVKIMLARHGYKVDINEEVDLVIYKNHTSSSSPFSFKTAFLYFILNGFLISLYLITGKILSIILLLFFISFGFISGYLHREKVIESSSDAIKITSQVIMVKVDDTMTYQLDSANIEEIEINIPNQEEYISGAIILRENNGDDFLLLHLFSDNVRFLEGDLNLFASYLQLKMCD